MGEESWSWRNRWGSFSPASHPLSFPVVWAEWHLICAARQDGSKATVLRRKSLLILAVSIVSNRFPKRKIKAVSCKAPLRLPRLPFLSWMLRQSVLRPQGKACCVGLVFYTSPSHGQVLPETCRTKSLTSQLPKLHLLLRSPEAKALLSCLWDRGTNDKGPLRGRRRAGVLQMWGCSVSAGPRGAAETPRLWVILSPLPGASWAHRKLCLFSWTFWSFDMD